MVTKEEIDHHEQFLLLPQCLPLLVIGYPLICRDFPLFDKICSKSSGADFLYVEKQHLEGHNVLLQTAMLMLNI